MRHLQVWGTRSRLRYYATSRKLAGSIPVEVILFKFTYHFLPHYGRGVDSASYRNENQKTSSG
jgi:hypothetical protein